MIPPINTRTYTNLVLTVIAVVLVATTVQQQRLSMVSSAQAQRRDYAEDISRTATGVPIDTTIPQTQDVAVAAATAEVAASNRQIADALREVAGAIRDGMTDMRSSLERRPVAGGQASPATPPAAGNTGNTARPIVEVE